MNIKPILVRLEGAMHRDDLAEQMVLLPEPASFARKAVKPSPAVNFVVGYNASPKSQTALDLTMWIAHQTRLATQKQVTVQVVYVIDEKQNSPIPDSLNSTDGRRASLHQLPSKSSNSLVSRNCITSIINKPSVQRLKVASKETKKSRRTKATSSQSDWFEQADRILWQARCLAEEWRGAFKAHLRFGDVATELKAVVEAEAAALLLLGCHSVEHPLVQKLGSNFPCSVLGIPRGICLAQEVNSPSAVRSS